MTYQHPCNLTDLVMASNSTSSILEAWSSETGEVVVLQQAGALCVRSAFLIGTTQWQVCMCSEARNVLLVMSQGRNFCWYDGWSPVAHGVRNLLWFFSAVHCR